MQNYEFFLIWFSPLKTDKNKKFYKNSKKIGIFMPILRLWHSFLNGCVNFSIRRKTI